MDANTDYPAEDTPEDLNQWFSVAHIPLAARRQACEVMLQHGPLIDTAAATVRDGLQTFLAQPMTDEVAVEFLAATASILGSVKAVHTIVAETVWDIIHNHHMRLNFYLCVHRIAEDINQALNTMAGAPAIHAQPHGDQMADAFAAIVGQPFDDLLEALRDQQHVAVRLMTDQAAPIQ